MIFAKEILILLISCAIRVMSDNSSYTNNSSYQNLQADNSFYSNFQPSWGNNHLTVFNGGRTVELLLDPFSGAGFSSKHEYCNGVFRMRMKIPQQKTMGIVTTFYMVSKQPYGNHDELDFEFIGTKGYLQTNIFTNDGGHREERINLWFDPSMDFHTYEIDFNSRRIVFRIDNKHIRVFHRTGGNYITKPLRVEASIWTGSWAGSVNWREGPFKAYYEDFFLEGTVCNSN